MSAPNMFAAAAVVELRVLNHNYNLGLVGKDAEV